MDLVVLGLVGLLAGFVDSIAGGGGLLALPALLWAGVPPIQALATSKLQGTFGTATSTLNYWRHGLIDFRSLLPAAILTFIGSVLGAMLVQTLPAGFLEKLVPVLLILIAVYFLFSKAPDDAGGKARLSLAMFGLLAGFGIGFYDGFFGPGTGSFFTIAFVLLLGYTLPRAIGGTKLLNLTANVAALAVFALHGEVLWKIGLVMAVGQVTGSYIGSHLAIRHGSRLIKPVLVIVSVLMSIKLLLQ